MRRHDHDKLLRETLTGEEVSDFRKASLAGGLAAVRRRRRYRRAAQLGALAALTLLVALGIAVHQRKHEKSPREIASIKPTSIAPSASPAPLTEAAKVKIISDEELFALFPGRAMALVGKPGEQQLVFVDGGIPRALAR